MQGWWAAFVGWMTRRFRVAGGIPGRGIFLRARAGARPRAVALVACAGGAGALAAAATDAGAGRPAGASRLRGECRGAVPPVLSRECRRAAGAAGPCAAGDRAAAIDGARFARVVSVYAGGGRAPRRAARRHRGADRTGRAHAGRASRGSISGRRRCGAPVGSRVTRGGVAGLRPRTPGWRCAARRWRPGPLALRAFRYGPLGAQRVAQHQTGGVGLGVVGEGRRRPACRWPVPDRPQHQPVASEAGRLRQPPDRDGRRDRAVGPPGGAGRRDSSSAAWSNSTSKAWRTRPAAVCRSLELHAAAPALARARCSTAWTCTSLALERRVAPRAWARAASRAEPTAGLNSRQRASAEVISVRS